MDAQQLYNVLIRVNPPIRVRQDKNGSFLLDESQDSPFSGFNLKWKELSYLIRNGSHIFEDITTTALAQDPLQFSEKFDSQLIICEFQQQKFDPESLFVTLQNNVNGKARKKLIELLKSARSQYGDLHLFSQEKI